MQETQKTRVPSLGWKYSLEKEMAIHSGILVWKSHGQRSQSGYSPWGHKEWDTTERAHTQTRMNPGPSCQIPFDLLIIFILLPIE